MRRKTSSSSEIEEDIISEDIPQNDDRDHQSEKSDSIIEEISNQDDSKGKTSGESNSNEQRQE